VTAVTLRRFHVALLLFALGGCSSSSDIAVVAPAIPPGKAQLTINRTTGFAGSLTKANVDVNGQRLGDFGKEDGYTTFIAPGRTTVAASAASPPGRYAIAFNTSAGKVYRLQITARPEGFLPADTSGPFPYELVENDGAFKIQPVD
jgi:hypothetical protein